MNKLLFAFVAFLATSPAVLACMCPPDIASWLRQADKILVVHINTVGSGREDLTSGGTCDSGQPPCFGVQLAEITTVYSIKGSGSTLHHISSAYGGGDCGIALIAGGYYVIFMRGNGHRVGSCNSAGPYVQWPLDSGPYPKQISAFVRSVQVAVKDPKAPMPAAPEPQQIGVSILK